MHTFGAEMIFLSSKEIIKTFSVLNESFLVYFFQDEIYFLAELSDLALFGKFIASPDPDNGDGPAQPLIGEANQPGFFPGCSAPPRGWPGRNF